MKNPELSRREFLQFVGKGVGITTAGVVFNALSKKIQEHTKGNSLHTQQENGAARAIEESDPLKVNYFARDIVTTAITQKPNTDAPIIEAIVGCFAGISFGGYALRGLSEKTNRLIGVTGYTTGKTVDIISTVIATKYINDPRFQEYGLGAYLGESNVLFPTNPTTRNFIVEGAILTALGAYGTYRFPSFGRGQLGASPGIAISNYETAHLIKTSLDIGDGVKGLISNKKTAGEIRLYLNDIALKNKGK